MTRTPLWLFVLLAVLAPPLPAQTDGATVAVIDTIVVRTRNVYDPTEAENNFLFRLANSVRFTTRSGVVWRELLFRPGEVFDSARVAESERNLRALGVFRWVEIDTTRLDDKLAVVVNTADGWSTQLFLGFGAAGGSSSFSIGVTETNFVGTANQVSAIYRNEPDRSALALTTRMQRFFGTPLQATGLYDDLSDGVVGQWSFGRPYRRFEDPVSVELFGEAADQRILQYRTRTANDQDTTRFQRSAFYTRVDGGFAPVRSSRGYLRVGLSAQVRREEFPVRGTALAVDDSVTGAVGAFTELRRARFLVVTHYNGFALQEDLDLSTVIRLSTWIAPSAFGYERSGVGPSLTLLTGLAFPRGFVRLSGEANALFNGQELDSGQVAVRMTVGTQLFSQRQATFLHLEGGLMESPTPGQEFDLGFGQGPRVFGAHAFVGTRAFWSTLEHRVFLEDAWLRTFGVGFSGFVDYGGAWYPDQPARFGGNVGFGIIFGSSRATAANIGRFNLGYRFGDGSEDGRWAVSVGQGFLF